MSYDLHVLARRQPRTEQLRAWLDRTAGVSADGALKRGSAMLVSDASGVHVEVDGPDRIESEDVPDAAAGAVGASGWLVALSVKSVAEASWPQALAVHLAREAEGVVYDPQQDTVTWPKGWRPHERGTRPKVTDVVRFNWYLPHAEPRDPDAVLQRAAHVQRSQALQLLERLRTHSAAALPRRYGEYEPCQHRFEGDDADATFADFWTAQSAESLGFFFWTAERPCLGATVSMTPPGGPRDPRAQPCTELSLTFDARPFFRDPAFTGRMIELFVDLATSLHCPYAGAFLNRTAVPVAVGAPAVREEAPFPFGSEWVGLPASPTWLAWFGGPYAPAVQRAVRNHVTRETERGLFLQLGDEPLDAAELAPLFPRLPGRLLARRGNGRGRWLPGNRYTLGRQPPSSPAVEILPFSS